MKITFLGAVQEVTGSRYLVEHENTKILVDCGLFQGPHEVAKRNRDPFPVDPKSIDAIVLTHAHIDHTGYIPALVKKGFKGRIYCSPGTYALSTIMLVDSGSLQEEEAKLLNHKISPGHPQVLPLYTVKDAQAALSLFEPVAYDTVITIGALKATLIRSGHILGSSFVVISDGLQTLTFSGDLGRPHQSLLKSPPPLKHTDFLVIESTYGNRPHAKEDPRTAIGDVVKAVVAKNGMLIIPCFAVERTEMILYYLYQLKQKKAIPDIPIFLDSPMAIAVAELVCDFPQEYEWPPNLCREILGVATYVRSIEESKKLDDLASPAIIIAGSGMADGGRVLFHLKRYITSAQNTVLFVGFQAEGTTGHALVNGAKTIKIHDETIAVGAEMKALQMLSAHADYQEVLAWLGHFENKPKKVFVTHGQKESALALQKSIQERLGWNVVIPKYLESFDLD